jgi:Family of unknown function (DUF5677)
MEELQEIFETTLKQVPRLALERRLAEKMKEAGLPVAETTLSKAAEHILSGSREVFKFGGSDDDVTIQITDDDIEHVLKAIERFQNEELPGVLAKVADDTANLLLKSLRQKWPEEFEAQRTDVESFKERLGHRWGKALGKLRMLLAIVREWSQEVYDRGHGTSGGRPPHIEDVMLRLHIRACQVTSEIIVLLENGYADGAMARWRTLHEIAVVAAVIAKFGEEIAERYVYYQIVESFSALKAYERNHKDLGFRPVSKRDSAKVRRDHAKVIKRFGKKFGEEYGWAAHHLKVVGKGNVTFARLEEEAGDAMMRSPYKMASYNVHASPKGVYFKLGSLKGSPSLLGGASNAGLTEPAQHAAVSLAEITLLVISDSPLFVDLVVGNIVAKLEAEIPREFAKADRKLHRDDRQHRKTAPGGRRADAG